MIIDFSVWRNLVYEQGIMSGANSTNQQDPTGSGL